MKRIGIFGFGLIGASIASKLRQTVPDVACLALDLPHVISRPEVRALSSEQVDSSDSAALLRAAASVDLVVLAAPVAVIARELPALLDVAPVVTDCGSTKRSICQAAAASPRARRFVPGHPMAGGPEGGAERARAELFQGQTWLLCPEKSDPDAVATVEQLLAWVGARSVHLTLEQHDRAVAYTSHVPQLVASALATLASRADALPAAGPAYRSTTRSAGGAELMWRDIFAANADQIAVVLHELANELEQVARGLQRDPADLGAALALLAAARSTRGT